jgi:hypothetical protein
VSVRLTDTDTLATPADVPVTWIVWAPVGLVFALFSVSVVFVVLAVGEKAAVTPVGRPLALNATDPAKLLTLPTVIVYVVLLPADTLRVVGEAVRVKLWSGLAVTGPAAGLAVAGAEGPPVLLAVTATVT